MLQNPASFMKSLKHSMTSKNFVTGLGTKMTKCIQFKTKLYDVVIDEDGTTKKAFNWKKKLSRSDCNLKATGHNLFNSELFPLLLNRYYISVKGEYRTWSYVDNLPANVSIDTKGFLAVISIELPEGDFR